jgi:hypothetical protein
MKIFAVIWTLAVLASAGIYVWAIAIVILINLGML